LFFLLNSAGCVGSFVLASFSHAHALIKLRFCSSRMHTYMFVYSRMLTYMFIEMNFQVSNKISSFKTSFIHVLYHSFIIFTIYPIILESSGHLTKRRSIDSIYLCLIFFSNIHLCSCYIDESSSSLENIFYFFIF
jgi:hypothetical protein